MLLYNPSGPRLALALEGVHLIAVTAFSFRMVIFRYQYDSLTEKAIIYD